MQVLSSLLHLRSWHGNNPLSLFSNSYATQNDMITASVMHEKSQPNQNELQNS